MTMVVSRKQRIHYRFEGEKGAYLLLHHGLFGSHQDWYEAGYVDALRNDFRLIVMDARGHGRSDRPLDSGEYRLQAFADDVIAIMDELDIRNLHFCGYSLGALVGFELLMQHPERVRIMMLAGESPFVSEAMQAEWRQLAERIRAEGMVPVREGLAAEQRLVDTASPAEQEGEQLAALALLEALATEQVRPDAGRLSVDSPVALFTGEEDPALDRVRDARRRIHRARFVSFPGKTHAGLFLERTALVAEMLRLLRPGPKSAEGGQGQGAQREDRLGRGGRGNRGRGRSGRSQESTPRASAPLVPPPPVDVPMPRDEAPDADLAGSAPAADSREETWESGPDAGGADSDSRVGSDEYTDGDAPGGIDSAPDEASQDAMDSGEQPPLDDEASEGRYQTRAEEPGTAPEEIAVRARQEQDAEEADQSPEPLYESDPQVDLVESAPEPLTREMPGAATDDTDTEDEDEEEAWEEDDEGR